MKVYSPDDLEMADMHYQICSALLDQGKQFEALQRLEKVIYMLNQGHDRYKSDPVYSPRLGTYYSLLGQFYFQQKQYENCQKCLEASLTLWQEYGMDVKEQGYQQTLELHNACLKYLNESN